MYSICSSFITLLVFLLVSLSFNQIHIQDRTDLCFPHLLNSSCRKPTLHWSEAVLLNSVMSFISLITVAFNLLIIISVSHFRQLHTPTNILLLSLAVSDFLVGLLLMPLEIYRSTACWFLGDVVCVLYFYLVVHIVCTSTGNIVLISVDRYVAICDPLHYPTRISTAKAKCCVCVCWLWNALYGVFFLKDDMIQPGRSNSCTGECALLINFVAGTLDVVLNFVFPLTIIIVLYMKVFVVAVSQARAVHSHVAVITLQHPQSSTATKSELRAARTLGILIVIYLACFCPYCFYSLIEVNQSSTSNGSLVVFLFYLNSCLNPVIYALFYSWFRKAIKRIISLQILEPGSREANLR
uniref:G-protein coupled receptors family 1 profile domain-containing protein n=1 Tax=Xiphophorus maculatus TaxID=8083 RepID=A0A3B5Q5R5_XIPMA